MPEGFWSDKKNILLIVMAILLLILGNRLYATLQSTGGTRGNPEDIAKIKANLLKTFPEKFVLDAQATLEYENAESTQDGLKLTRAYATPTTTVELVKRYRANFMADGWQEVFSTDQDGLRALSFTKDLSRFNLSITTAGDTTKFVLAYYPRLATLDDPLRSFTK